MTELTADDPDEAIQDEAIQAVLRRLSLHATRANLDRVQVMSDALTVASAGVLPEEQRLAAAGAAHQVLGSAGTFGFRHVSPLAAWLEHYFRGAPTSGAPGFDEARQKLAALEAGLRHREDGPQPG